MVRLSRLVLRLYPLAFRGRYGDEMLALLEDSEPGPRAIVDLLRGALVAHLRPPAALTDALDPGDRLRASASGVLACWVAFAAAGFGFYKTTEDAPFAAAGRAHPLLGAAHLAIQVLAVLGSVAVLAGALPLVIAALRSARTERKLRLIVSTPPLAVAAFAVLTGLLVWLAHAHHGQPSSSGDRAVFVAWELAGLAVGAVCVAASRRALFLMRPGRARLLGALASGTLATAAMAAMALATALYAIALRADAPGLAAAQNGPLRATSTAFSLGVQLVVMALAACLATVTTRRGWRAAFRR
jgi:hypothetical protein